MQYIGVNGGDTFIEYDPETHISRVIVKSEIENRIDKIEELKSSLVVVTDEEYLAWAKEHYPVSSDAFEMTKLNTEKQELEILLGNLN